MDYGLLDPEQEDEWTRRQREIEQLRMLGPADPGAPMGLQDPIPLPRSEMPPLQLDSGPDWTDALGVGVSALGGIADLALNKGKGFGQIAASAGAYGAARAGQRVQQEQQHLQYEEKRAALEQRNAYQQYLQDNMQQRGQHQAVTTEQADRRLGLGERNTAAKERGLANAETREDPSELIAWAAKRGYDLQGLETMGQARAALGPLVKEWELEHAGEKAGATERGRTGVELDMAPQTNAVAADRARGVAEATEPVHTRQIEAGARATARAAKDIQGERSIANVEVIDPEVYRDLSPKQVEDVNKIAGAKVKLEQAMTDMERIQARTGSQVLASGDKSAYDSAQTVAIAALTVLGETGVLNGNEYKRYLERIPGSAPSMASAQGLVQGKNVVGEQIRGTRTELSRIFDAGLSQYGVRGQTSSGKPAQPAPAGSAAAAPAMPVAPGYDNLGPDPDHPSNLGVTAAPGVRNTPPFPGGGAGGAGAVYRAGNGRQQAAGQQAMPGGVVGGGTVMRSPSGNVGPVPPDKVQAAIAAGWTVMQ